MTDNRKAQNAKAPCRQRTRQSETRLPYVPPIVTSFSEDDIWRILGPAKTGSLDGAKVRTHRPVFPVGIQVWMAQPRCQQQRRVAEPLHPHIMPPVSDQRRIGRAGRKREHGGGPAQVFHEQSPSFVVNVVRVAIVGRTQGDNSF